MRIPFDERKRRARLALARKTLAATEIDRLDFCRRIAHHGDNREAIAAEAEQLRQAVESDDCATETSERFIELYPMTLAPSNWWETPVHEPIEPNLLDHHAMQEYQNAHIENIIRDFLGKASLTNLETTLVSAKSNLDTRLAPVREERDELEGMPGEFGVNVPDDQQGSISDDLAALMYPSETLDDAILRLTPELEREEHRLRQLMHLQRAKPEEIKEHERISGLLRELARLSGK